VQKAAVMQTTPQPHLPLDSPPEIGLNVRNSATLMTAQFGQDPTLARVSSMADQ
jgi:hypothetical protein